MTRPLSKKANDYLKTDQQDVNAIFSKVRELAELSNLVMPFIPDELKEYCHVANRIQHQLVIMTANGSVATQLKFQTDDFLRKFKQDPALCHIQSIVFKVHPGLSTTVQRHRTPKSKPVPPLTPETAKMISEMADSIEDEKLREVMKRIAGRV